MALVKTHSNYVLKSKHQTLSDGSTIWERDITTIGGLNQFAPGQTPIYRSGNFIITVRDDNGMSNQYTSRKWKDNASGGNVWRLEDVSGSTSDDEQNDTKIVLKNDYFDFLDFAYYGSLSELFRASINDIILRFPGELYVTDEEYYYNYTVKIDGQMVDESEKIADGMYYVSNPFGIDIHSKKMQSDGNAIRFFCDGGYKNYSVSTNSVDYQDVTSYSVEYTGNKCPEKGKKATKAATVKINGITIEVWVTLKNDIVYLSKNKGVHITPKKEVRDSFYNSCNVFQRLILNPDTTPKYKATFSVITEDDYGTYRKMEDFTFPTGKGGYNIDTTEYGMSTYTSRLAEIGSFYDEYYTDNLYRSMTHEAIKNFDWTYTREYGNEDELEENVFGGERMQKAMRVFAREFDDILMYINAIKNVGRITYDDRGNIPNYFLSDTVTEDGWDVRLVYPFNLKERDGNGKEVGSTGYTNEKQLCNEYEREFFQDASEEFTPYDEGMLGDYKYGYFISCCKDNGNNTCRYNEGNYFVSPAKKGEYERVDSCANGGRGMVRKRIKSYTSPDKYTNQDLNNEFLKRLKINSRHILRHKGTIDGVEMMLALFGMKSQRYVDGLSDCVKSGNKCLDGIEPDYKIEEFYAKVSDCIYDEFDECHNMYTIDWINSTKMITYDYRSVSNYSSIPGNQGYVHYQGLPVASWKAPLEDGTLPLYPHFSKYEKIDGDPYFQMNGGWLSKRLKVGSKEYGFQFDVEDRIVHTEDERIFKETVRKIRRFNTLQDMLSSRYSDVYDGMVAYVSNISSNECVIDGKVYEVEEEAGVDCKTTRKYVTFVKTNGMIAVGGDRFYTTNIIVYGPNGTPVMYNIEGRPNGYSVKAYIHNGSFLCGGNSYAIEDDPNKYRVNFFKMMSEYKDEDGYTNYFLLTNSSGMDRISDGITDGWKRLRFSDKEYNVVSTIQNYSDGNNPHNGDMHYDLGNEYFENFSGMLFWYAYDNDLFNITSYDNMLWTAEEINSITKWAFEFEEGSYDIGGTKLFPCSGKNEDKVVDVNMRGQDSKLEKAGKVVSRSILNSSNLHESLLTMNTKNIRVTFYLHYEPLSKDGQRELKYIDDVVLNYMTQMIPSTAILEVVYEKR